MEWQSHLIPGISETKERDQKIERIKEKITEMLKWSNYPAREAWNLLKRELQKPLYTGAVGLNQIKIKLMKIRLREQRSRLEEQVILKSDNYCCNSILISFLPSFISPNHPRHLSFRGGVGWWGGGL